MTEILQMAAQRAITVLQAASARPKHDPRILKEWSWSRALQILESGMKNGFESEVSRDLERDTPATTANSLRIPDEAWQVRTAETVAVASQGGYLVETDVKGLVPFIGPYTTLLRSQPLVLENLVGNVTIPRISAQPTPAFVATESTQTTAQNQTFGSVSLAPRTAAAYTEISRLLLLQAPGVGDKIIPQNLAIALGQQLDKKYFGGSGLNGELTGIVMQAGNAFSATGTSLAVIMNVITGAGDAITPTTRPAWFATPAAASILRQRAEVSSGTRTLWTGQLAEGNLCDYQAWSSSNVPNSLIFAPMAYVAVGLWRGGVELSTNPYANFQAGIIGVRAMVTTDVALLAPSATYVSSNALT